MSVHMQAGVYYAVPSSVPGVQQIVYSVAVDSTAGLLHDITDQPPTIIHVCYIVQRVQISFLPLY